MKATFEEVIDYIDDILFIHIPRALLKIFLAIFVMGSAGIWCMAVMMIAVGYPLLMFFIIVIMIAIMLHIYWINNYGINEDNKLYKVLKNLFK